MSVFALSGFMVETAVNVGSALHDCYDVLNTGMSRKSGVYEVNLWKSKKDCNVYCDLETSGGGWTVFQYRYDGSVSFFRNFKSYTQGFGSLDGEFWLGLESIYEMVSLGPSELRIELMAADGSSAYEVYQNFSLSPGPDYTLHIGTGNGTAGDFGYGLSYHNGQNFYTYDRDNGMSCAHKEHGGWWFYGCSYVYLNGEYIPPGTVQQPYNDGGIVYFAFQKYKSLKRSKMMFRRTGN